MTRRPLPVPSPRTRLALLLGALLLGGCNAPDPAPDDGVPDPQAQAAAPAEGATELRDAIDEPLDKAKAVEASEEARDAERRADLEEAGG